MGGELKIFLTVMHNSVCKPPELKYGLVDPHCVSFSFPLIILLILKADEPVYLASHFLHLYIVDMQDAFPL